MRVAPKRTARRRAAEVFGRNAEHDAAAYLVAQGFVVLAQRLRTPAGEIDLVMANRDILLFVEVKARSSLAEAAYAGRRRRRHGAAPRMGTVLHPL